MELTKEYNGKRWKLVYGHYSDMEQHAVDLIQAAIKRYVPYILPVYHCSDIPNDGRNTVYVGTKESNPAISRLMGDTKLPEDGIYISVKSKDDDTTVIICGDNEASCYYAAAVFIDDYLPAARRRPVGHPFFVVPFVDALPDFELCTSPAVKERGLWTWGHVIYDYKAYIKNMARLKLNAITVWNDFAPINGRDFVNYAHSWGIKVIWGYSWIWDENPDKVLSDPEERARWKASIVKKYTDSYAPLGGDGIYFQTFTETDQETVAGKNRAAAAVEWVNEVAEALYEINPELEIQFGLHASSVRNHLDEIAKTDKRINIIWEDCGSFPYHYNAANVKTFERDKEFSQSIASLRGGKGFGAVMKGMTWLDWGHFEHQTGPFIIGESEDKEIAEKLELRRDIIRYQQSLWLQNGHLACEIFRMLAKQTAKKAKLYGLLEDSLFDENIWLPSALFAELLWDGETPYDELMSKVARRESVKTV